jgi:subtilisin family serine protease
MTMFFLTGDKTLKPHRSGLRLGFGLVVLASVLSACGQPPPPVKTEILIRTLSDSTTQITQVTVATGLNLQATTSTAVQLNWSVVGGSATNGSVSAASTPLGTKAIITYTAPAAVPTPATITVRATNANDPTEFGEINLTVIKFGEGGISGKITVPAGLLSMVAGQNNAGQGNFAIQGPEKPITASIDWSLPHVKGQVLVLGGSEMRQKLGQSLSASQIESVGPSLSRVMVPANESEAAFAARLGRQTGAVVQPNYIYHTLNAEAPTPNDPFYSSNQFYLTQIDASGAWSVKKDLPDGLVAVIDSGVDTTHPDLQGRIIAGKDFCPVFGDNGCAGEDTDPSDGFGHGTHVTGIIAAATNTTSAFGMAGITWTGKVLAIKALDNTGTADSVGFSKSVRYAIDQKAKVINMSLGVQPSDGVAPDPLLTSAIADAVAQDIVVVAAAGNWQPSVADDKKKLFYPASDPRVIPVGAVDQNNTITSFSARGDSRLIMAPGTKRFPAPLSTMPNNDYIFSTNPGGNFKELPGTSQASPMVAAVAGLIRAQNPSLNAQQVKDILYSTAKDLGAAGLDPIYGSGLLQAGAALRKATNPNTQPLPKTTIYVYADLKVGNVFDGNNPKSGRSVVILDGLSGVLNYAITAGRDGKPLSAGTYRIVACVNKNSNGEACDAGDLGGSNPTPQSYSGTPINNIDITVANIP